MARSDVSGPVRLWRGLLIKGVRVLAWRELPGFEWASGRFIEPWAGQGFFAGHGARAVRGKLHGYEVKLDLASPEERAAFFLGRSADLATQLVMLRALRPGDRFVDVGAGIGMHTLLAARLVGERGWVDAVEPDAGAYRRLRWAIESNAIQVVRTYEKQLWIERGDEALAPEPKVHVVRIEAGGHECGVVEGLAATLRRDRPLVVTPGLDVPMKAQGSSLAALFAMMRGLGFVPRGMTTPRSPVLPKLQLTLVDPSSCPVHLLWYAPGSAASERVASLL